ncbi:Predicted arabinose efflux permease, MFS family [Agromyces sp. CF514]|uniref:MFS transporter n=1 Tax=Agromyces sp. CF514 TaxID=1881031 RepID=UPI0008E91A23|nr:MFS transporter [Agromyces sp. CF514]SFR71486.1 Predicted arabinose efflux permease, MFS family [Agromyces sp. CF514]
MSLGRRASFFTAASVAGLALWASGAPTVVYPLYAAEWSVPPTVTTAIFAVYPLVLVPVLIVFGNLSDTIGRRAVMLMGLAAVAAGAIAFALAPDLASIFVGRALMGVGVGLSLSPATAAMVEFGGADGASRAASATTASTASGLALSTILGGFLVQYAPAPMHLSFWVLVGVTAVVAAFVWALPRPVRDPANGSWRPRPPRMPRAERRPFVAGTLGIAAAYAMGAIFLALGAQIARDLVRTTDAFVDGAVIALSAISIGVVALLARRMPPRLAVTIGPALAAAGLGLLVYAGVAHSLPAFIAASLVAGGGYSLMFSGGLGLVTTTAPAHERAAVISAAYVVGYLVQALAAFGLGALATAYGLQPALEVGAPLILAIGLASFAVANLGRRRADSGAPSAPVAAAASAASSPLPLTRPTPEGTPS